jgi:hypothetical protein
MHWCYNHSLIQPLSNIMSEWAKVITQPSALAGFVLFLTFVCLAWIKRSGERRWIATTAFALAILALLSGLIVGYSRLETTARQPRKLLATPTGQPPPPMQQTATGPASPAVQGVQGNVTITPGHSTGKPEIPTPAAPLTREVDLSAVDQILQQLPTGNIAFNVPGSMVLGQTYDIHLLLSPHKSIEDLQAELTQRVEGQTELKGAAISIAPEMEARLSGQNFEVTAVTPERQWVSAERDTDWEWTVGARMQGNQELHLTLNVILTVNNTSLPRSIRSFDRRIIVRVTWGDRLSGFIGTNWQWLWTALVVPLAAFIWRAVRKRKRRPGRVRSHKVPLN